jgi:hypothetical protein
MKPMSVGSRAACSTAIALLGSALLLIHTALLQTGPLLTLAPAGYRYWVDFGAAASRYLGAPAEERAGDETRSTALFETYRDLAQRAVDDQHLAPWQFWRTVDARPFRESQRAYRSRSPEDPGRAALLTMGFHALGGIAPFLLLWLAPLLAVPVLAWAVAELVAAGRAASAAVFAALVGSSLFIVGTLSSSYSPVGFYVIALLSLVAFATYAVLGRVSPMGLAGRLSAASTVIAIAVSCRAGTLLLLPGFVVAAIVGARRTGRASFGRALLVGLAILTLPLAAYARRGPGEGHVVWMDTWSGLGDFDRTGTHRWSNAFAKKTLRDAGRADDFETPAGEAFFRERLKSEVRAAPWWYAQILGRRLFATVTQQKLWPWAPRDGRSMAPSAAPEEGAIDDYYRLVPTADRLALGRWRVELPISALIAPTLLLAAVARRGRREPLLVLACMALSALALPVLVSTAGAFETEAFVLIYFLGAAFLVDELAARVSGRSARA